MWGLGLLRQAPSRVRNDRWGSDRFCVCRFMELEKDIQTPIEEYKRLTLELLKIAVEKAEKDLIISNEKSWIG